MDHKGHFDYFPLVLLTDLYMNITQKRCWRGGVLFALVSMVAYSIWAFGGRAFPNEGTLYAAITLCFFVLGGLAIFFTSARKASLARTWSAVALGFLGYGILWSACWFWIGGTHGETFGNFAGWTWLTVISRKVYRSSAALLVPISVAFLSSSLGYYLGELVEFWLKGRPSVLPALATSFPTTGKLMWGLFHGLGLGYGLAFINDWFTSEDSTS